MTWIYLTPSMKVKIESEELKPDHGTVNAGKSSGKVGEPIPFTIVVYFNRVITEEDCERYILHYKGTINGREEARLDMTFGLEPGYDFFKKTINVTFAYPGEYEVGGRVGLELKT